MLITRVKVLKSEGPKPPTPEKIREAEESVENEVRNGNFWEKSIKNKNNSKNSNLTDFLKKKIKKKN